MASILDDLGKPKEAIKVYKDALAILGGDSHFRKYLSSIHYNLGVTYMRSKQYNEARTELKSAVEYDFSYASPHYVLSSVYNGTGYKVPAFLAAARFVSLEYNTARARTAAGIIRGILKPAAKDPKTGNTQINLNLNAPVDEGDFGMYELLLGTLGIAKDEKDKNRSADELFVDSIGTLIALIGEDTKLKTSFVGKDYVPFIVELKQKGYADIFGYMVLYVSGQESAMSWLNANDARLGEFLAWAKAYQLPK
jgi:tetratricopeptide (TPR) repeat protein